MLTDEIQLNIQGKEFDCLVNYSLIKGEKQILGRAPEFCQEGSPDEYEINSLMILSDKPMTDPHYFPLWLIDEIKDQIIIELELIRNEA